MTTTQDEHLPPEDRVTIASLKQRDPSDSYVVARLCWVSARKAEFPLIAALKIPVTLLSHLREQSSNSSRGPLATFAACSDSPSAFKVVFSMNSCVTPLDSSSSRLNLYRDRTEGRLYSSL
jgi:hypothetical protein